MVTLADFSNNLATDLAPLLALFGESMTIQYLSECTTIADYIIFATGPVGIITALVSAMRICGGAYTRAFIGRAREGAAAAEVELCTSTGRDVCELFTRGGIARSLGKPSILELVYLQPDRKSSAPLVHDPKNLHIYRKYLKKRGGERWPWPGTSGETTATQHEGPGSRMKKAESHPGDPEQGDVPEKGSTKPEPDTDLPNLSLNVGIVNPPRGVFLSIAALGVILQTGVLALAASDLAGVVDKDSAERPLVRDAPLFIIGMVSVCLGMGACAALIGRTTREFTDTKREPERERLLWLQPGNQKIGDQSFGCYAIFETRQHPVTSYVFSTMDDRRRSSEKVHLTIALVAPITFLAYIIQFMGIRGLNAWVSLSQLIITIVMSLLRGTLRMRRRGMKHNELKCYDHSVHGHELDWLAFNLACDDCRRHRYSQESGDSGSEAQLHRGYAFQVTGKTPVLDPREEPPQLGLAESLQQCQANLNPKAVFEMRARLANLTGNIPSTLLRRDSMLRQCQKWDNQLVNCREKAYQISKAVCDAAAVLLPDVSQRRSLRLQVGIGKLELDVKAHQIAAVHLKPPSGTTSTAWTIDTAAVEALLGLWVWSLTEPMSRARESHSSTGSDQVKRPSNSARILSTGDGDEHWGRRTYVETELWMLLGTDTPTLKTARVRINPQSEYGIVNMWPGGDGTYRAHGGVWQQTPAPGTDPSERRGFFGWQRAGSSLRELGAAKRTYTMQYVNVTTSILDICAQEVYTALISSMASSAGGAELALAFSGKGADRRLVSDGLSTIRASFVEQRLGTTSDAVLCLLPALRDKIRIQPSQDDIVGIVLECLTTTDWKATELFLRWAVLAFEGDGLKRIIRATAEFYRRAMVEQQQIGFCTKGIEWLASKVPRSFLDEDGIIRGYEAVIQRVQQQGLPEYAPEELLNATGLAFNRQDPVLDEFIEARQEPRDMVTALYLLCGTPILLPEDAERRADAILRHYPYDWADWVEYREAEFVLHAFRKSLERTAENPGTLWSSIALAITWAFSTSTFSCFSDNPLFRTIMEGYDASPSLVFLAVDTKDYDVAYLLRGLGAYTSKWFREHSPLSQAAWNNDLRMIHLLLPSGTSEEKEIFAFQQLLFRSAWERNLTGLQSAVAALQRRNGEVDKKDEDGRTALSIAAGNGDKASVKYLLSLGSDVVDPCTRDSTRTTPLSWALKEYPRVVDADSRRLAKDYDAVVQLLLRRGHGWIQTHEPDWEGRTPIMLAALTGSKRLTKHISEEIGDYEVEDPIDVNHQSALSLAARDGHTKILKYLLAARPSCKPNKRDRKGQTAVHVAASEPGRTGALKALLESPNVNVNIRDREGRTPLSIAASLNFSEGVQALLNRKDVAVSAADNFRRSPLSHAAEAGCGGSVAALLQRCPPGDVNAEDHRGWTPLIWAIKRGRFAAIDLLVRDKRIRVPHPYAEYWNGKTLVDFTSQATRDLLVLKLGVWRRWEDEDGNLHWDKADNPKMAPVDAVAEYVPLPEPDPWEMVDLNGDEVPVDDEEAGESEQSTDEEFEEESEEWDLGGPGEGETAGPDDEEVEQPGMTRNLALRHREMSRRRAGRRW